MSSIPPPSSGHVNGVSILEALIGPRPPTDPSAPAAPPLPKDPFPEVEDTTTTVVEPLVAARPPSHGPPPFPQTGGAPREETRRGLAPSPPAFPPAAFVLATRVDAPDLAGPTPTHDTVTGPETRPGGKYRAPSRSLSEASRTLGGKLVAGRYRLVERLTNGTRGEAYRARQVDLDRDVALKILSDTTDPEELERFARDAKVTADIHHPGVAQVFDAGVTDDGSPYMAMELLEGQTLGQRIAREGPLAAREATRIAIEVCRALAAVHDKGVVHRNLQPSSIFLARKPDGGYLVKLIDFGSAKHVAVPEDVRRTARVKLGLQGPATPVATVGTPAYQSPEQILGHPVDPRSDVYALAVVLYEMIAGAPPFGGPTPEAVFNEILATEAEPLRKRAIRRDVTSALEAEIARALSKSQRDRHTDAVDFAEALERAVAKPTSKQTMAPVTVRASDPPPAKRGVGLVVATVVAIAVAVVAWQLFRSPGHVDATSTGEQGSPPTPAAPSAKPSTVPDTQASPTATASPRPSASIGATSAASGSPAPSAKPSASAVASPVASPVASSQPTATPPSTPPATPPSTPSRDVTREPAREPAAPTTAPTTAPTPTSAAPSASQRVDDLKSPY